MRLYFTKMHGLGNDYIYVNCFDEKAAWLKAISKEKLRELVVQASRRHTGIGADGMIFIMPSNCADCRMKMYNADGSAGAMCGNGIRCVARYVRERGIVSCNDMKVETDSGIREIYIREKAGRIEAVRVDMGGVSDQGERRLLVNGHPTPAQLVSVGNPHCVLFMENVQGCPLHTIGEQMQAMAEFQDGVNVEIAQIRGRHRIEMRVFERGAGETMACGTGACAVCAAAVWQGYCRYDEDIEIVQPGGHLITVCLADGRVMMEGPAEFVFEGVWEVSEDMSATVMG